MSNHPPLVSIIVPSLAEDLSELEESIKNQNYLNYKVHIVSNVKPNGRARNEGVRRSAGEVLVFIDDDAVLAHDAVISNLVDSLMGDPTIGIVGGGRVLPPDSPWFQRRVAKEVPRIENPIVDEPLETNPPLEGRGFSEVTTTCCAMRRETFAATGGFSESLIRGVDTEFFYRVRLLGYRFILAPRTWVYHPAPSTLPKLLRKYFLYGVGHSQEARKNPEREMGFAFKSIWHALGYLILRKMILIPSIFVPYSYSYRKLELGFKPIKALASYASALGYVWGWYKFKRLS